MTNLIDTLRRFFQSDNDWEFDAVIVSFYLSGKLIPRSQVIKVLGELTGKVYVPRVEVLADLLSSNTISLAKWQTEMAALIKEQHIISAIAGKGSRELMTYADWGRTGGRLGYQYNRLDNFAREIAAGHFSPEYIKARAKMYMNATRTAFWDATTQAHIDSGKYTEERRVLGIAEHCPDCEYWAELGWSPIGTLPKPGDASVCIVNCKCTMEWR